MEERDFGDEKSKLNGRKKKPSCNAILVAEPKSIVKKRRRK